MAVYPVTDYVTCTRANLFTGTSISGYGRNSAGTWTGFGANTLRYDYSGGIRRLLVEESRTNSIRNNSMQGVAAGSPGTVPTNWSCDTSKDSITRTVVGTGTQNGIDYVDIQIAGTPTATGTFSFGFESNTQIVANVGETWTGSAFVTLAAGSLSNVTVTSRLTERAAAGGILVETSNSITPLLQALNLGRVSSTRTLNDPTPVARVTNRIVVGYTNGLAIDITLRIGWPQLELGSFATSPIRTQNAAVTRSADVVSMTLPTNLTGLSSYTLYAKGYPQTPTANSNVQIIAALVKSSGTSADRMQLDRVSSTGGFRDLINGNSVLLQSATIGTWAENTSGKLAAAQAASDQAFVANGSSPSTLSTAGTMQSIDLLSIGHRSSAGQFNGGIEQVGVWGSRRTNSALQTITT